MRQIEVLQDWIRVDDLEVDVNEHRTYEFHVVQDPEVGRVTLTIRCLDGHLKTVRVDPTVLNAPADPSQIRELAERRVRHLYTQGRI